MDYPLPGHDSATSAHHSGAGSQSVNSGAGVQANNTFGGPYSQQYNGPVNFLAPRRESVFGSLSLLPSFSFHNDEFVCREEIEELSGKLGEGGKRVVIFGLSGIGKTRLAVAYCHRFTKKKPDAWVLWANASSAVRFDRDIQGLAQDLRIASHDKQVTYAYQSLRRWLLDKKRTWLFVLDDADNVEFLYQAPSSADAGQDGRTRIGYLTVPENGSLLITTRYNQNAHRIVGRQGKNCVEMTPNQGHAIAMLQKILGATTDMKTLTRIAAAFDSIPLAVAQVAARLEREASHSSLADYLSRLESDETLKLSLLTETDEYQGGYEERGSIKLEWTKTLERILEYRPSAAHLLCLMSFYHHQSIPMMLLYMNPDVMAANAMDDLEQLVSNLEVSGTHNEESFNKDVGLLRDYALITRDKAEFKMSRLLQLVVHDWLKQRAQYTRWESQSLIRLCIAFPEEPVEHMTECLTLYPHVKTAMVLKPLEQCAMLSLAKVLYRCSEFLAIETFFVGAQLISGLSLELYEKRLGHDHPETLAAMLRNASYLRNGTQAEQSEAMYQRLREIIEKKYGVGHVETLGSIQGLAWFLRKQGKLGAAEDMQRWILKIREDEQGHEHPDTLTVLAHLAENLRSQRRYASAEEIQQRVLEITLKAYGPKHVYTLSSHEALAKTFKEARNSKIAEPLQRMVLTLRQEIFGLHQRCARRCGTELGQILLRQGQYDAAEEIFRRHIAEIGEPSVEEVWELGDLHLFLGNTLRWQNRWEAAESSYRSALATTEVLGDENASVLETLAGITIVQTQQGMYEAATTVARRHLNGAEKALGLEHLSTISSVWRLAYLLHETGEHFQALQMYERAYVGLTRAYGPNHPDTVMCNAEMASWKSKLQTLQANSDISAKAEQEKGPESPQKHYPLSRFDRLKVTFGGNRHKT